MFRSHFVQILLLISVAILVTSCSSDSSSSSTTPTPPTTPTTPTDPPEPTDPPDPTDPTDPPDPPDPTNPGNNLNQAFVDIRNPNIERVSFQTLNSTEAYKNTAEYAANAADFDAINITAAWAAGATGAGVTIAVVDTGIYNGIEFQGKSMTQLSNITIGNTSYSYDHDYFYADLSHGTSVASVLAANYDAIRTSEANVTGIDAIKSSGMVGVAYGADLLNIPLLYLQCQFQHCPVSGDRKPVSVTDELLQSILIREVFTQTFQQNPEFMNVSFSLGNVTYQEYKAAGFTDSWVTAIHSHYIEPFLQLSTAHHEKTVIVFSAGNYYGDSDTNATNYAVDPNILATLPELVDELTNLTIAVVASTGGSNQTIASYSNRCGIAADYCIMAPGSLRVYAALYSNYNTTDDEEIIVGSGTVEQGYVTGSGTSFAAPLVTGALAVVYDYFNGSISSKETRARILTTADNSSCQPEICGRGFLDVGAALQPVGGLSLVLGNNIYHQNYIKLTNELGIDIASGSAWLPSRLPSEQVITLDQLNSPFRTNLADLVSFSQTNQIDRRYLHAQQDFATDLGVFNRAGYAFDGIGSSFHLSSQLTNGISTSFSIANDRNLLEFGRDDQTTLQRNLAIESSAIGQYSDSSKADYLSFSVGNQHHTLTSGICLSDSQCEILTYNFNDYGKSLALGFANRNHFAFSEQMNDFGISYDRAFSGNQLAVTTAEMSFNAGWDLTALLNVGFGSQRVEYSSVSGQQSVYDGSNFVLLQDKLSMNMQLSSASGLHIEYLDQSDSQGSTAVYLPVDRTKDGAINYDSFTVDFDTRMQRRTSVGYSLNQSDISGKFKLYLQLNRDKYISGSDNQLAMQIQLYM